MIKDAGRSAADHGPRRSAWRRAGELLLAFAVYLGLAILCRPFPHLDDYTREPLIDPAGILQVYPWVFLNFEEIARGHFPLWNQFTALGQPHLANLQTGVFFPLWWLWYLAGRGEAAYGALLLLRLALAGLFWFYYARKWMDLAPALAVGAAYSAGGYCLWFMQLVDLNSQMLLPLCLVVFGKLVRAPTGRGVAAGAILTALAILGGHPEAAFITVLVACLYALVSFVVQASSLRLCGLQASSIHPAGIRAQEQAQEKTQAGSLHHKIRSFAPLAITGLLGVAISAAAMLPFLDYLPRCWTLHGPGFGFFHLDPRAFFNLIMPGAHNLIQNMPPQIPVEHVTKTAAQMFALPYRATAVPGHLPGAGLVICGLAAIGFIARRRSWRVLFFAGLLALALGLTFGLPGFNLIAFLPPFNLNSNFKFFFSEIHASLALLAGVGVQAGIDQGRKMKKKKRWRAGKTLGWVLGVGGGGVTFALAYLWLQIKDDFYDERIDVPISLFDGSRVPDGFGILVFEIVVAFLLMSTLLGLAVSSSHFRRVVSASFLIGVLLNLFVALSFGTYWIHKFIPLRTGTVDRDPRLSKIAQNGARLVGIDYFFAANKLLLSELKDVRSSDALFYRPNVELINKINMVTPEEAVDFFYPSYFLRPSSNRLVCEDAKKLSLAAAIGHYEIDPNGITELVVTKGHSIYGVSKPTSTRSTSIFLHAPARLDFSLAAITGSDLNSANEGALEFIPNFGYGPSILDGKDDGVVFMAISRKINQSKLLFYRYCTKKECHAKSTACNRKSFMAQKDATISLSTLPGPQNDVTRDWASFENLSYQSSKVLLSKEKFGINEVITYLNGYPWSMRKSDEGFVPFERGAGDEVEFDVREAGGETVEVHEAWYPGWRAWLDGEEVRVDDGGDKVQWRVAVPEGAKTLSFHFVPVDFRVGLFVSLASLLAAVGVFSRSKFNRR